MKIAFLSASRHRKPLYLTNFRYVHKTRSLKPFGATADYCSQAEGATDFEDNAKADSQSIMKKILFALIMLVPFACQSEAAPQGKDTQPPAHTQWDLLLKKHVDARGMVDYEGFIRDKEQLEQYLKKLSNTPPDPETWSEAEQLAYWINAYNAFTVKLIADNYPVESIEDLHPTINIPMLNTVWHKKFFKIGGRESSLDEIEHKILRKQFNEPRIHFAINCASYSCPPLRGEAYTARIWIGSSMSRPLLLSTTPATIS